MKIEIEFIDNKTKDITRIKASGFFLFAFVKAELTNNPLKRILKLGKNFKMQITEYENSNLTDVELLKRIIALKELKI